MRCQCSTRPSRSIRRFVSGLVLALSVISCSPHSVSAAADDDVEHYDGRVQGYDPSVELKSWGTGGCWMMLIAMGVGCIAVIFKDAKRSHLD